MTSIRIRAVDSAAARLPAPGLSLWIIFATTACASWLLAWQRYASVHHQTFDLALYARMAWGFMHGDGYSPIVNAPVLGVHISLILAPLSCVGALFGQVPTLLAAQAISFAACVWPMFRLGTRHLGSAGGSFAVAAWVLYPNLAQVVSYEFHPSNLAVLPLCWCADALDRRDPRALLRFGLLALACREDMGLVVALYGAALTLATRGRRGGLTLATGTLGLLLGAMVTAAFRPASVSSLNLHFGAWGGSPLGIVPALLAQRPEAWDHISSPATLWYLPCVLAPLCGLPLRAPLLALPALGPLALNLVSTFPTTTQLYSHYLTPAVPALVSAGIVGMARWARGRSQSEANLRRSEWLNDGAKLKLAFGWIALTLSHWSWGGTPLSKNFDDDAYVVDARTRAARRVLEHIPRGESVQAPDPLLPHLSERRRVHRAPPPELGTRWVVLDVSHRTRYARKETLLRTSEEPLTRTWLARTDHTPRLYEPPWLLLERRPFDRTSAPVNAYYDQESDDVGRRTASPSLGRAVEPSYRYEGRSPNLGAKPFARDSAYDSSAAGFSRAHTLCDCLRLLAVWRRGNTLELALEATATCPNDLAVRLGVERDPKRVDLLFDGVLSPGHLLRSDRLISRHDFAPETLDALERRGVWVGALRSSGAPPARHDPRSVHARLGRSLE